MKILHINSHDLQGGAARAVYRIHNGLSRQGISSSMLVQFKSGDDINVAGPVNNISKGISFLRPIVDGLSVKLLSGVSKSVFSPALLPFSVIPKQIDSSSPDIVHLHWICDGMLRIENLKKIKCPIVWTLHDMWAFTGGCHYSGGCENFKTACGNCPQLFRGGKNDLSKSVLKRKLEAWKDIAITIVTPSTWLAACAGESRLFRNRRIEVIHNGLDLNLFKPIKKRAAREIWNFPQNKKLILFGMDRSANGIRNYSKGSDLLFEGIKGLPSCLSKNVELIVFGSGKPLNPPDFGLPVHYTGYVQDEISMTLLYNAADLMLVPSREDNLPNTVVESLACGTPVTAFHIGGMPDMIEHKNNGYLAKPFDTFDLASGIEWVLSDDARYRKLCTTARKIAVASFDVKDISRQYADLYGSIL
ncbi:MAG: glycosyltransferase family 4 protein [Desulfobacterales bacterium]|nr:glycosyltransferase family 4 protein [Desulfobacterales bacterium]